MIWWLSQPSLARSEKATIAELEERSPWLAGVSWLVEAELRLAAHFTIRLGDDEFQLKLVYPSFFPDTPPQVLPREEIRLSQHQWGPGGELCLEYRADNWDPTFTGAMMIQSAYNLLSGERPSAGAVGVVPSAHRASQAQYIRGNTWRFLISDEERALFRDIPPGETVELALSEHENNKHWLIHPERVGPADNPTWSRPQAVIDGKSRQGFVLRVPGGTKLPVGPDCEALHAFLMSVGALQLAQRLETNTGDFCVLLVGDSGFKLLWVVCKEKQFVVSYTTVELPASRNRLPESYTALREKSVALVGCGSMGSKVAVSLARSGVKKLVLVDEDIFYPDNLVRNDLDGRAVGMHKVDALAARVLDVSLAASVLMKRIKLSGQESAASTDSALQEIAACDLIIDATADPQVFNLCASVARRERKPMVWGHVFAGGIGGLIARARPDFEPPPHAARRQLWAWCDQRGVPWDAQSSTGYDAARPDAPPLVADDADVSVVAAHVTRLSVDTLLRGTDGLFPYPAYAIGLAKAWIFEAPFEVFPIAFSPEGSWGPDQDPDSAEQLKALVAELFPSAAQEANAS